MCTANKNDGFVLHICSETLWGTTGKIITYPVDGY